MLQFQGQWVVPFVIAFVVAVVLIAIFIIVLVVHNIVQFRRINRDVKEIRRLEVVNERKLDEAMAEGRQSIQRFDAALEQMRDRLDHARIPDLPHHVGSP